MGERQKVDDVTQESECYPQPGVGNHRSQVVNPLSTDSKADEAVTGGTASGRSPITGGCAGASATTEEPAQP